MALSIFSCAYNISVSSGYNTPLLMTIRPNNNIMESVKRHAHTLGHTNNTLLTDCFVSQNKHIEGIVSEIIARMDRTHTGGEREGRERQIICSGLSQIGPIHIRRALCGISSQLRKLLCLSPRANGHCLSHMRLLCCLCYNGKR